MSPHPTEIMRQRAKIDRLRRIENGLALSAFTRGQLSGAQQVLWWLSEDFLEPASAFLSPSEQAAADAILSAEAEEAAR